MWTKEHNKEEGLIAVINGAYGSSGEEVVMNSIATVTGNQTKVSDQLSKRPKKPW